MTSAVVAEANHVHIWKRCHVCNAESITGPRFECQTCPDGPDNDLCERCYSAYVVGKVKHPMPGSFAALSGIHSDKQHAFTRFVGDSSSECTHWAAVPNVAAAPPLIRDRFVVRPEFCSGRESFIGSYAFVVDGPSPLLLTCLHVMSNLMQSKGIDASPKNRSYSGRELPAIVTGVELYDAFAPNWMAAPLGRAARMLSLPNARTREEEPFSQNDIAAFGIDSAARVSPAPLAERPPGVGEPIWLVVKSDGGAKDRTIGAVVVEQTERTFIFRYLDQTKALPRFSSGAPLVNRAGEVVAINVGDGRLNGQHLGHANHVTSIRRHLGRQ